ncbi:AarF/ABC1/UbiB kinase family protein [Myxococcota bacterium]|nr:AarF/ABC1/UbiB kinase family protein [Myxococcota bacterium]
MGHVATGMGDPRDKLPAHLRPLFAGKLPERAAKVLDGVLEGQSERLGTGRLGRALSLSKLAVGSGSRMLLGAAKDALTGSKDEATKTERGLEVALDMLETFSELRGMAMKVGQMLSYLDDALPPEARKVLAVLQRDVSPMPWAVVREQLVAELGREPEQLFTSIETTPIAAASIGQVHRAVLPDGTKVAVKIQYPGIDQAMSADLKNAKLLSTFKKLLFYRVDTEAIMDELEQRFMDECDYRKEADYQEAYRTRLAGHPWIVVPEVHRAFSGQRVLTTTLMEGSTFYEWLARDPSADERARVTRTFYRFYMGSFYLDGLFNCDPHPGNYLFRDDGKIVFLDYGCSRVFPEPRRVLWVELCRAVRDRDEERMHELGVEMGFFPEGAAYDRDAFHALMDYLYLPYLEDEPFDFRAHRPEDTFKRMFTENPNLFKLNMPADAVFLNRIGFGLVSLLSEVGATLNCHRYSHHYFRGVDPDWDEDPHRPARVARIAGATS